MAFVVFQASDRKIVRLFGSQTAANTYAATDAALTAFTGDVAGDPQPGEYLTDEGAAQVQPSDYKPPTAKQNAIVLALDQLGVWRQQLSAGQGGYWLTNAEHAIYNVANGLDTSITLTDAEFVKAMEEIASGATDINSVPSFYASAKDAASAPNGSDEGQTNPKVWYDFSTKRQTALNLSPAVAGGFHFAELATRAWISSVT